MEKLPLLVIGNKNYSSWSLRPWLLLKQAELPFDELRIPLYRADSELRIREYSSSGKVPVLIDGDVTVWDSLAICEYLAENHPGLWPAERSARAFARSICAEMHSGFAKLREQMTMNCRRRFPGKGRTPEVEREIGRVVAIWEECLKQRHDGAFLFGKFGVADAMYAPVVLRFQTYAVDLPPPVAAYAEAILALPALQQWLAEARAETEVIEKFELYA